jgi:hypothetical protein
MRSRFTSAHRGAKPLSVLEARPHRVALPRAPERPDRVDRTV